MVAKIFILELGSNPGMELSPKEGNNVVAGRIIVDAHAKSAIS